MAQLQRSLKAAAREGERRQRAAVAEHNAAVRKTEQARRAEERARVAAERANEQERKRLEREAAAAHVATMKAEAEERNAALAEFYDEIDTLLQATLDVDDYVDLETLRQVAEHPPFDRQDLEAPVPPPPPILEPLRPHTPRVVAPKGLLGRKKKLAQAQAEAQAKHDTAMQAYQDQLETLPERRASAARAHAEAEERRKQDLAKDRARYEAECEQREAEVAAANQELDNLITNLGYGTVDAVDEYVSIVLANSIYPEHFPVKHDAEFDPATAELTMSVLIPPPDAIPTIKTFRYVKARDEIAETALSQKARKDRYRAAVEGVTLRTLHEIFEADRRGLIQTIALEVGTHTIDPATGQPTHMVFAAVGAERDAFMEIDLSAVVPSATLDHLGAAVSKNPYGLVAIKGSGVRTA